MQIDAQRVAALARLPRRGRSGSSDFATAEVTQVLGFLTVADDRLSRPVMWSKAACLSGGAGGKNGAERNKPEEKAAEVCACCPIFRDCSTALMAGAPVEVRQWRQRADGGRAQGC